MYELSLTEYEERKQESRRGIDVDRHTDGHWERGGQRSGERGGHKGLTCLSS